MQRVLRDPGVQGQCQARTSGCFPLSTSTFTVRWLVSECSQQHYCHNEHEDCKVGSSVSGELQSNTHSFIEG